MKTKIAALITALLLMFVGAGGVYYISQTDPEVKGLLENTEETEGEELPENQSVRIIEEPIDTRIEDWLNFIGREMEQETIAISDATLSWETEIGSIEVLGKSVVLEDLSIESVNTILTLFAKEGFTKNPDNSLEDENINIAGFEKEDTVCLVKTDQPDSQDPNIENSYKVEIRCGLINSDEIIIKSLYFEEREREPSALQVDVTQSTSDHMSGSVQFTEPDEDAAPDKTENFLAARDSSGEWVLVYYDGDLKVNCDLVELYNFPEDMVSECLDRDKNLMIERINPNPKLDRPTTPQ